MRTITIELNDDETQEFDQLLEDKRNGVWCDESWPHHFAYLIAGAIERNDKS